MSNLYLLLLKLNLTFISSNTPSLKVKKRFLNLELSLKVNKKPFLIQANQPIIMMEDITTHAERADDMCRMAKH